MILVYQVPSLLRSLELDIEVRTVLPLILTRNRLYSLIFLAAQATYRETSTENEKIILVRVKKSCSLLQIQRLSDFLRGFLRYLEYLSWHFANANTILS